jgi:hypothetical protein
MYSPEAGAAVAFFVALTENVFIMTTKRLQFVPIRKSGVETRPKETRAGQGEGGSFQLFLSLAFYRQARRPDGFLNFRNELLEVRRN